MPSSFAGRLADLLPLLGTLEEVERIIEKADRYHSGLPKGYKEVLVGRGAQTFADELLVAFMQLDHGVTQDALRTFREHIAIVHSLIEEAEGEERSSDVRFSEEDLATLRAIMTMMERMGSNSKRDLRRFLDAMMTGDRAYAVFESVPAKTAGRKPAKVEARFASVIPVDAAAQLNLPS